MARILAGSRRRAACIELGIKLRVRIIEDCDTHTAFKVALTENGGRRDVSLWDWGRTYERALDKKLYPDASALAEGLGIDKSTVSRALSLRAAPEEVLALFPDKRGITATQWYAFCPLLDNETQRERIIERAGLVANSPPAKPAAVFAILTAAALNKATIEKHEVLNDAGKLIATIKPSSRGGFTVSIKSLAKVSPQHRSEMLRRLNQELSGFVRDWCRS